MKLFVCCDGDVDLSLHICGKMDVLWARTKVMVGSWWSRENKKREKKLPVTLSLLVSQSPFCRAVEQFPPLFWNPSSAFLLKYADFLFTKNFPPLSDSTQRWIDASPHIPSAKVPPVPLDAWMERHHREARALSAWVTRLKTGHKHREMESSVSINCQLTDWQTPDNDARMKRWNIPVSASVWLWE